MLEHLEKQKLTANQWKIVAAATLGDMLDFFDFFLIGFVLAFIVGDWHLTYRPVGDDPAGIRHQRAVSGSLFWGWMADKIGRRKVIIATVLNFSIATGIDGADAGGRVHSRLAVPGVLPLLCRLRR